MRVDPSKNAPSAKVRELQRRVDEAKNAMTSNLERILERGERLTSADCRNETLAESSQLFKTQTGRVRQKILLQNLKYILTLAVLVTITIIIVSKVFSAKHRK